MHGIPQSLLRVWWSLRSLWAAHWLLTPTDGEFVLAVRLQSTDAPASEGAGY